jgi:demethylmenaquinone methyltransferase/2-methoxy-6-polyprenyl-1,4-benzoquinol methylase
VKNNNHQINIDFFNHHADNWESKLQTRDHKHVQEIISRSKILPADHILDVGCGTGILTHYLLKSNVQNITAIDIAPKMIKIYKQRFPNIESITNSFEKHNFIENSFNIIFIFNAFPHFYNPETIFEKSYNLLKTGGKLIIAHSMTREELNQIHRDAGKEVENDILISDEKFRELYHNSKFQESIVENTYYFYSLGIK